MFRGGGFRRERSENSRADSEATRNDGEVQDTDRQPSEPNQFRISAQA